MTLKHIWDTIWTTSTYDDQFQDLIDHYQQPWLHYHTLQHLEECFFYYQQIKNDLFNPKLTALILFYHDSIYNPQSLNNEQHSADYMESVLNTILNHEDITIIKLGILATQDHKNPLSQNSPYYQDIHYILDIDLSILASPIKRFLEYEQQIRSEYYWVDVDHYQEKRKYFLNSFYQQSPLFKTHYFQQHCELHAKQNLYKLLYGDLF